MIAEVIGAENPGQRNEAGEKMWKVTLIMRHEDAVNFRFGDLIVINEQPSTAPREVRPEEM